MKKQNQAFTLVELIVVITILAILGTIAFISLQGYSAQARDSKRLSDIQNIKTSLELFSLSTGKYPFPDDSQKVTYTGSLLWEQGIVGDDVSTNLSRNLIEKPTDPLTETEYTFSVTHTQTEYELLSVYESDLVSSNNLLNQAKAENRAYPKIDGTYNGVFIKISDYYIPTPSIINAEILDSNMILDNINIKSQIITGGENNLAYSNNDLQKDGLPGLELSPYYGTLTSKSDPNEKIALIEAIQNAYTGSILANQDVYSTILNTVEDNMDELANSLVGISDVYVGGGDDEGGKMNPYLLCESKGEKLEADTYYGDCNTKDIIICAGFGTGYTLSACNVGTDITSTTYNDIDGYGYFFQFGRNISYQEGTWTNADFGSIGGDWESTGRIDGIDDGSANYWGVYESEKSIATYLNPLSSNLIKIQGPCLSGYHVPTSKEWVDLVIAGDGLLWDISGTTTEGLDLSNELKLPMAGSLMGENGGLSNVGNNGEYMSSSPNTSLAYYMYFTNSSIISNLSTPRGDGNSVRCFKN